MRLFGGGTKKQTSRKRTNFTDKKEREEYLRKKKEDDILHEEFVALIKEDPELRKQTMATKYKLNLKAADPVEKRRKDLQDKITQKAIERLDEDPEFAERMIQAEVDRIESEGIGLEGYEEDNGNYGHSPFGELMEAMEMVDKVKEKFGSGNGGTLDTILNSKLIEGLGPILLQLMAAQQAGGPPPPVQMGTAPPPPAIPIAEPEEESEPIKPEPVSPPKSEEQIIAEQEERLRTATPEPEPMVGSEWMNYLEDTPDVFVTDMRQFAQEGNQMAILLLDMLQTKTAETLLAELQPLKAQDNVELKMFVEALEAQPWWLDEVIALVRGED